MNKNEDAVNFSNFDSVWNHGIISGPDPRSIGHFISETYRTFALWKWNNKTSDVQNEVQ